MVENGDRFARDLVVQETGIQWLGELFLEVVCVDNVGSNIPKNQAAPGHWCVKCWGL